MSEYSTNPTSANFNQFGSNMLANSMIQPMLNNTYLPMNGSECNEDSPPAKIANLSTKYPVIYENGHRRFGPPADWFGEPPLRGCEVFIGKIPRDCNEDEIIPIFENCGKIYEFRLMVDFNGVNRGYAFCVYQCKEDANTCVDKLNNYEIRPGKNIGVCFSVDNCRLFVGGIPKNKSKEEIFQEMQRVTNGVVNVIAYPSIANKNKNRGFAFVEYESHKAAAVARRKLIPGKIPLWGQQIAVDWAEPEREVHESIMANVKILYARNLMLTTTEDTLREKFLTASGGAPSCIERVKKMKDYAFIHFTERHYAENAKNSLNFSDIDGSIIEVSWAKPADKSQTKPNKLHQSNLGDITLGDLQAAAANTTQIYFDPNTGLSYLGPAMGSWGNSLNILGDTSNRTRPCRRNAAGTRSLSVTKDKKQSIELLEEMALSYNWGSPQYTITPNDMDRGGSKITLYSATVYLPNIRFPQTTQILHATAEEAKSAVAELVIRGCSQQTPTIGNIDFRQQLGAYQALQQILINPHSGPVAPNLTSNNPLANAAAAAAIVAQQQQHHQSHPSLGGLPPQSQQHQQQQQQHQQQQPQQPNASVSNTAPPGIDFHASHNQAAAAAAASLYYLQTAGLPNHTSLFPPAPMLTTSPQTNQLNLAATFANLYPNISLANPNCGNQQINTIFSTAQSLPLLSMNHHLDSSIGLSGTTNHAHQMTGDIAMDTNQQHQLRNAMIAAAVTNNSTSNNNNTINIANTNHQLVESINAKNSNNLNTNAVPVSSGFIYNTDQNNMLGQ